MTEDEEQIYLSIEDHCSNSSIWNGVWISMIHTSNDKYGGADDPCDDWSHHPIP